MEPNYEQMCQMAAKHAVKEMFSLLGVNVDIPKEVDEFRRNLQFGASMRRAADKGVLAMIGALAVGFMAALWAGVVKSIVGGP